MQRPVSCGTQDFAVGTDPSVGQPIKHHSAVLQVTGEAKYTDDIPKFNGELYGALVLTMNVGSFPMISLAFYVCLWDADEWRSMGRGVRGLFRRPPSRATAAEAATVQP